MTTTILLLWCLGAVLIAPLVGRVLRGHGMASSAPELVQHVVRRANDGNGEDEEVA